MSPRGLPRSPIAKLGGAVLPGLLLVGLAAGPAMAGRAPGLTGLRPGEEVVYTEEIPVNVAFLGGPPVDHAAVTAGLPATYEPVARIHRFLEVDGRPLGLRYEYDYRLVDAGDRLADWFFGFLARTGEIGDRIPAQDDYNDQEHNRLDVPERVLHIDARAAERWLNHHARAALGLERDAYTVFFVNWFGRPGFEFHTYATEERDPDSGAALSPRHVNAWGGSARSWFLDLSAGPNIHGGSWNVDDDDLTGNGQTEYRIPAAWEYHPDGFRDPAALSADLGLVTRYVAINLLFTPSPFFDPMVSVPRPGGAKVISLQVLQDLPGGDAVDRVQAGAIRDEFAALQPYHDWEVHLAGTDPIDADARRSLEIFAEFVREQEFPEDPGCWEPFGNPGAELFCFFDAHRDRYFHLAGPADHLAPAVIIEAREDILPFAIGVAEQDLREGVGDQAFAFGLGPPAGLAAAGVSGFTALAAHELGHYFAFSHTYDGWDSEEERDYSSFASDRFFVSLGAQAHSVMGAGFTNLRVPVGFSELERDSLARWETAGHLNLANALAGRVLAHPDAHRVSHLVTRADQRATGAQHHLAGWRYDEAARQAIRSYEYLVTAAERLGMDPAPVGPRRAATAPATTSADWWLPEAR